MGTSPASVARRRETARRTLAAMSTAVGLLLGVGVASLILGVSPWLALVGLAVACSAGWLLLRPRSPRRRLLSPEALDALERDCEVGPYLPVRVAAEQAAEAAELERLQEAARRHNAARCAQLSAGLAAALYARGGPNRGLDAVRSYQPEPPASVDDIPMTTLSDAPTLGAAVAGMMAALNAVGASVRRLPSTIKTEELEMLRSPRGHQ